MNSEQLKQQRILLSLLLLFYVVFLMCAILLQLRSGESPSRPGTVFDIFSGSILWMLSISSILIATLRFNSKPKFLLWLAISAAAGALAIDEIFEFHEKTTRIVGDDDYFKIISWLIAGIGSYILYAVERPTKKIALVFVTGYLFHTLYLVVDMGDGDFFSLPFSTTVLIWAEEILETLALQGYLAGFLLHYTLIAKSTNRLPSL